MKINTQNQKKHKNKILFAMLYLLYNIIKTFLVFKKL